MYKILSVLSLKRQHTFHDTNRGTEDGQPFLRKHSFQGIYGMSIHAHSVYIYTLKNEKSQIIGTYVLKI